MPHVPSSQSAARKTLSPRMAADRASNAITSREPVQPCSTCCDLPALYQGTMTPVHSPYTPLNPNTTFSPRPRSKSVSYAVWCPDLARAHVTVARGVHFTSMGHSVQRPSPSSSSRAGKPRKRLELLPEEALYLMEKGALFCWKATSRDDDVDDDDDDGPGEDEDEDEGVEWDSASQGAPMSVQQAYAEMIGRQDLTLERYQVCEPSSPFVSSLAQKPSCYGPSLPPSKKKTFSYLRRLGYIVTRARPPSPAYPVPASYPVQQQQSTASSSIFRRVLVAFFSPIRRFLDWLVRPSTTWWRPLVHRRWLHHNMDYRTHGRHSIVAA